MAKKSKKEQAAEAAPGSKSSERKSENAKKAGAKKAGAKKTGRKEAGAPDIAAVAKKVKAKAADLASNPLVAEVVAATLVAAAAAIKDPKKARAIAASVGDELGKAAKGAEGGSAMWKLAMDVAKRSVSALSDGSAASGPSKTKAKKKS